MFDKISTKQQNMLLISILAILYFSLGKLSYIFLVKEHISNMGVFPSEGIALAFALYFGKRVWPGIFIGQFALAMVNGLGVLSALGIATTNSIEAIIAVILFKLFRLSTKLESFRDVIGLGFLIFFILQPFSAMFSNLCLYSLHQIKIYELGNSMISWWFGNVMGQGLYTPLLLLLFNRYKTLDFRQLFMFGVLFTIYFISIGLLVTNILLLLITTLTFVIIIVYNKGSAYGMLMSVIASLILSYFSYKQIGVFSMGLDVDNIINYNLFVISYVVVVLVIGILFEEHERFEMKLQQRIDIEVEKNKQQQQQLLQQSRLAQMGEMIAMIAHQWRQPLSAISGASSTIILKSTLNQLDKDTAVDLAKNITSYTLHLSHTIDDFRNFFKVTKEKQEFTYKELLDNVLNIIEPSIENKGIAIKKQINDEVSFNNYANEIKQVLLNLIKNAEDILVEKNIENPEIQIIVQHQELIIIDNAGGIPEEIIDKIFDPYFSTKGKNGTGLGLYMSKIIIEEHCEGKLYVENTDFGAKFTLLLQ